MEYHPGVREGTDSMLWCGLHWTGQPGKQLLHELSHASHVLPA